jgi:ubiquinone biosynthesis protein UbiJ
VTTFGVGLLVEEHRGEIAAAWRGAVAALGAEPALGFAVAPILRDLSLALREEGAAARGPEAWARIAVLVRSSARPSQLAREMKLLSRAIAEALAASDEPVSAAERIAVEGWLYDALAECLDRVERVRQRLDALDRPAAPAAHATPPPLPRRGDRAATH